jgi:hypothetical protein
LRNCEGNKVLRIGAGLRLIMSSTVGRTGGVRHCRYTLDLRGASIVDARLVLYDRKAHAASGIFN